jgi:hypothetical protein
MVNECDYSTLDRTEENLGTKSRTAGSTLAFMTMAPELQASAKLPCRFSMFPGLWK